MKTTFHLLAFIGLIFDCWAQPQSTAYTRENDLRRLGEQINLVRSSRRTPEEKERVIREHRLRADGYYLTMTRSLHDPDKFRSVAEEVYAAWVGGPANEYVIIANQIVSDLSWDGRRNEESKVMAIEYATALIGRVPEASLGNAVVALNVLTWPSTAKGSPNKIADDGILHLNGPRDTVLMDTVPKEVALDTMLNVLQRVDSFMRTNTSLVDTGGNGVHPLDPRWRDLPPRERDQAMAAESARLSEANNSARLWKSLDAGHDRRQAGLEGFLARFVQDHFKTSGEDQERLQQTLEKYLKDPKQKDRITRAIYHGENPFIGQTPDETGIATAPGIKSSQGKKFGQSVTTAKPGLPARSVPGVNAYRQASNISGGTNNGIRGNGTGTVSTMSGTLRGENSGVTETNPNKATPAQGTTSPEGTPRNFWIGFALASLSLIGAVLLRLRHHSNLH